MINQILFLSIALGSIEHFKGPESLDKIMFI